MPAQLFFLPFPTAFTSNGIAAPGAKLYFYESGTTTPIAVYDDAGLTTPHPHPVPADGAGRFESVYLEVGLSYRLVIKDRAGATLADIDPYIPGTAAGAELLQPYVAQAQAAAVEAAEVLGQVDDAVASATASATASKNQAAASALAASGSSAAAAVSAAQAVTSAAGAVTSATNAGAYLDAIQDAIVGLPSEATLPLQAVSRTILASFTGMAAGRQAILSEVGRSGLFVWSAVNNSANVTADPLQGYYVAPASAPTGASGAWVRVPGIDLWTQASWFGALAGAADNAPAINAALAHPKSTTVLLGDGTFDVGQAAVPQSNKALLGAGRDKTFVRAKAGHAVVNGLNSVIGSYGTNIRIAHLTVDANKIGMGTDNRRCGIQLQDVDNAVIEDALIKNCSGYAAFSGGIGTNRAKNVRWERVIVLNAQYHFEQMQSEHVSIIDCISGDGDGDIGCGGFIHPVFDNLGSRDIRVVGFRGFGAASAACEITGSFTAANEEITFDNCRFELTGTGIGLVVAGGAGTKNVRARNTQWIVPNGIATNVAGLSRASFTDCEFIGGDTAFQASNDNDADLVRCLFKPRPIPGAAAYGVTVGNNNRIRIRQSEFDMESTGSMFPIAGAGITVDRESRFYYNNPNEPLDNQIPDMLDGIRELSTANSYPLALEDQNKTIRLSGVDVPQTVFVLADASVPFPTGTVIYVTETTNLAGPKKVLVAVGVTINSRAGLTDLLAYGTVRLEKVAANTWNMSGDLG